MTGSQDLRISELAERSNLPVATVKFYLREGLLPRGTSTSATQATYGTDHVARLGLVRVLTAVGGLSLAQVRAVCDAVDARSAPTALHGLDPSGEVEPGLEAARLDVDRLIDDDLGWRVHPDAPARGALARAVASLRSVGRADDLALLKPHARAADWLVSEEMEDPPGDLGEAVLATVAFDAAATALRHLAWEHRTSPARIRSLPA